MISDAAVRASSCRPFPGCRVHPQVQLQHNMIFESGALAPPVAQPSSSTWCDASASSVARPRQTRGCRTIGVLGVPCWMSVSRTSSAAS